MPCDLVVRVMRQGGTFALHAHCALLLDYVPPKSPQAHSLETPLELGVPNCPSSRKLQTGVHSTTLAPLRAILVNTLASWENGGLA